MAFSCCVFGRQHDIPFDEILCLPLQSYVARGHVHGHGITGVIEIGVYITEEQRESATLLYASDRLVKVGLGHDHR